MVSSRPRLIASSLLLLTALGGFLLGAFSRPKPADAAGTGQRRFIFGPISVAPDDQLVFQYFNSGALPTPAALYELRFASNGAPFNEPFAIPSVAPGGGPGTIGVGPGFRERTDLVAIVTFSRPLAHQAIPSPFPATLEVLNGPFVRAVVYAAP